MTSPHGLIVDIHCHILPGIDDGARDMAESLEMARMAVEDGVAAIITTPHHFPRSGHTALEEASLRVTALQGQVDAEGLALALHAGQEIFAEGDLARRLESQDVVPLNRTPYVLVEPPFTTYPTYMDEVIFQLQLRGYRPIIAHPERNADIQRDPDILLRLVKRGVLSQVNTGSLLGHYGAEARSCVEELLLRNLAHVMATDAHSSSGIRTPNMGRGVKEAARLVGEERASAMATTVPQAILEGKPVAVPAPEEAKPARRRLFGLF